MVYFVIVFFDFESAKVRVFLERETVEPVFFKSMFRFGKLKVER